MLSEPPRYGLHDDAETQTGRERKPYGKRYDDMRKPNERTPPRLTLTISNSLASAIIDGAAASGLSPEQYVLSVLWHNVPLAAKSPTGVPKCVQLVLNDIEHYYCSCPAIDPYEECGMTQDDFCGAANDVPF